MAGVVTLSLVHNARVGIGRDIHRLVAGRALTLGGVAVPSEVGFATPSDGDVLSHALIDALAGAIGEADMGRYFPADDDPPHRERGASTMSAPWRRTWPKPAWRWSTSTPWSS